MAYCGYRFTELTKEHPNRILGDFHSCELKEDHKGRHKCGCEKMRYNIEPNYYTISRGVNWTR